MSLKVEWEPPEPDALRMQCGALAARLGYRLAGAGGRWSIVPLGDASADAGPEPHRQATHDMTLEEVAAWLVNPWLEMSKP